MRSSATSNVFNNPSSLVLSISTVIFLFMGYRLLEVNSPVEIDYNKNGSSMAKKDRFYLVCDTDQRMEGLTHAEKICRCTTGCGASALRTLRRCRDRVRRVLGRDRGSRESDRKVRKRERRTSSLSGCCRLRRSGRMGSR